jgi:hypothetical protein
MTHNSTQGQFAHRTNGDGTVDSICRMCFATIATSHWETDLERKEKEHICDPSTVERFRNWGRP